MTIEGSEKYTPKLRSSEFGDALRGPYGVSSEIHLEAVIG